MEKFHIPKPFSSFLGLFWYFFLLGFPAQYCSSFLSSTVHIHTIHNHSKIYTTNSYKHRLSPPIFSHVLYHHWSIFCILTFFNYGHLIFFVFSSACFLIFVLWSLQSFNNIFFIFGFSCQSLYLFYFSRCALYSGQRMTAFARRQLPTSSFQWTPIQRKSWKWGIRYLNSSSLTLVASKAMT